LICIICTSLIIQSVLAVSAGDQTGKTDAQTLPPDQIKTEVEQKHAGTYIPTEPVNINNLGIGQGTSITVGPDGSISSSQADFASTPISDLENGKPLTSYITFDSAARVGDDSNNVGGVQNGRVDLKPQTMEFNYERDKGLLDVCPVGTGSNCNPNTGIVFDNGFFSFPDGSWRQYFNANSAFVGNAMGQPSLSAAPVIVEGIQEKASPLAAQQPVPGADKGRAPTDPLDKTVTQDDAGNTIRTVEGKTQYQIGGQWYDEDKVQKGTDGKATLKFSDKSLTAAKASSAKAGPVTAKNIQNLAITPESFYAGEAASLSFYETDFTNVQDFLAQGDTVYVGQGDLVIESRNNRKDFFHEITDSWFVFANGKVKEVLATSAVENNQFILGNNVVILKKNATLHILYTDEGMQITSSDIIQFQSLETNEVVDINGSTTIIQYNYNTGIACTSLGQRSRYSYNGSLTKYEPFALYNPVEPEYTLCLRKADNQSFAYYNGLIDLINKKLNLTETYEYERLDFLGRWTDIIDADNSSTLSFSDNAMLFLNPLTHNSEAASFYSGAHHIYYNQAS